MLLLMPKRKARKDLFSTDDARRKTARVELERYERLRTTRVAACCEGKGPFQRVAISRSQDAEELRDASRHAAR